MASARETRDHEIIRRWAEAHGGEPAIVKGTEDNDSGAGLLRIKFDETEDDLEPIEWDEFFDTFDDKGLTFLYQPEADKSESRFFKFVDE